MNDFGCLYERNDVEFGKGEGSGEGEGSLPSSRHQQVRYGDMRASELMNETEV